VQTPLQPANTDPVPGVAASVTTVALSNDALHAAPQVMPAGVELMVPLPRPARVTVSANCDGGSTLKVAVTVRAWLMSIWQLPVPAHAPPQLTNAEPVPGVAASATRVPAPKLTLQSPLAVALVIAQLIPTGVLVTVPRPVPDPAALSV